MSINIFLAILVTSLATFLSRFLGFISSVKIKETSKIFRWFNCLAITAANVEYARQLNHLNIFEVSLIFTDEINPKNLERNVAKEVTKIAKNILIAIKFSYYKGNRPCNKTS